MPDLIETQGLRRDALTVVIPAHNEAAALPSTLASLAAQTRLPENVLVVSDNSTDETMAVAWRHGAGTMATQGNTDRKAGALNQALARVTTEFVMVLDADTTIAPEFIEHGLALLAAQPDLGAVGGVFAAAAPSGRKTPLLHQMQANEFARYATQIEVTGRTAVLTGTAAIVRTGALRAVADARGSLLPGRRGDAYDRRAITEDSELTLALRTLGFRLASPSTMTCRTETMPTLGDLMRQRIRWYGGMLENLRAYGFTRVTARYFGQQAMLALGTLMLWTLAALTTLSLVLGSLSFNVPWLLIGGVFFVERLVTVWAAGIRARALAAAIIPELTYDLWLQVAFVRAAALALRGKQTTWNHVPAPAGA